MIERFRIFVLLAVLVTLVPGMASAQARNAAAPAAQPASAQRVAAPAAGPRVELTATAMRSQSQRVDSAAMNVAAARRNSMGRPMALIIVGSAAFVAGALIGGDAGTIFMIGGAVTALVGLDQYFE